MKKLLRNILLFLSFDAFVQAKFPEDDINKRASINRFDDVKIGMSVTQVIRIMGDSWVVTSRTGLGIKSVEEWTYEFEKIYILTFHNGTLFTKQQIRQSQYLYFD